MAVKLGKMLENKREKENIQNNEYNRKLEQLKNLIQQCEPIVGMAKDMFDTYHYVKDDLDEKEFAKQLWIYLGYNNRIVTNSYFGFKLNHSCCRHCDIGVSRYGVCIYKYECESVVTINPDWDCNKNDSNTWRGKYLLSNFLEQNKVSTDFLNDAIFTLERMIDNFQNYADGFFKKVSEYNAE